jgi:hypothetical protein
MSLVSTASLWTNDDTGNKKRQPTMRKTIKVKPANTEYEVYSSTGENNQGDYMIHNLDEIQKTSDERANRVNEIINKMSSVSGDDDGAKLADFNPPPNPVVHIKKDLQQSNSKDADPPITSLANPLQIPAPTFSNRSVNPYVTNNAANISLGNYQQVYTPQQTPINKPYYASMGIGGSASDGKVMERINYMIHMLENMEHEKTANVTEEFVLYTFLGVFVIYVLDSFSRSGKYVR